MSTINLQTLQAVIALAKLINQISSGQVGQQPVSPQPPASSPYLPYLLQQPQSYLPQFAPQFGGYPPQAQYAPQQYLPQQYAPQFYRPQTSYLQQVGLGQQFGGLGMGGGSNLFNQASGLLGGYDPAKVNALNLASAALNSQYGIQGNPVVQRIMAGLSPFG